MSANAELLPSSEVFFGREGPEGLPLSVARTLAHETYGTIRASAVNDNHMGDVEALKADTTELTQFLHGNFNQVDAQEFLLVLRPWIRPSTEVRDDASLSRGAAAGLGALQKKFGMVDTDRLLSDANAAARHIVKHAPSLKLPIFEHGAANDPKVIEHLASLARRKGWK